MVSDRGGTRSKEDSARFGRRSEIAEQSEPRIGGRCRPALRGRRSRPVGVTCETMRGAPGGRPRACCGCCYRGGVRLGAHASKKSKATTRATALAGFELFPCSLVKSLIQRLALRGEAPRLRGLRSLNQHVWRLDHARIRVRPDGSGRVSSQASALQALLLVTRTRTRIWGRTSSVRWSRRGDSR